MELNQDNRITAVAADKRGCQKEESEQNLHEVAINATPFTYSL
jgi:hypothetical protein